MVPRKLRQALGGTEGPAVTTPQLQLGSPLNELLLLVQLGHQEIVGKLLELGLAGGKWLSVCCPL